MAYENDVLTRNDNDELAVRTVQTTGDNPGAYDDIYTRDNNGKLCVRVTGAGGGGGSDPHNLGWYATQSALETAHPTADDGDWAIVGSTDTVWVWDSDNNEWKDTDQKGQVESVNGQTGTVVLTASDVGAATTAQGAKADTAVQPSDLATVATTGSYTDLTNTPTIPAAQVNSDWNSTSGVSEILNKPTLATVATSGSYDDLTDKPTIPAAQVNSDWNAASGVAQILNKPTLGTMASESASDYTPTSGLATVATTGSYSDLSGTPTIPAPTQVSTLPTAGVDELGNIYQFVGTTDANYTNGYFYKCVSDGQDPATYSWEQTDVMPAGSSLPDQTGQSGKFLTTDGTDASWSDLTRVNTTITLAAANWSSNTQTVSVTGMTADGVVMVSPDPSDQSAYTSAGILCTAQAAGTLTFTCDTVPSGDIDVNVVML